MNLDARMVLAHVAKMAAGGVAPEAKVRAKRYAGRVSQAKAKRTAAIIAVRGGTECLIPVRTVSESNTYGHWRCRQGRAKNQRAMAKMMVSRLDLPQLPVRVVMTRIGKRMLDDDNLAGSLKAVRDGIADAFGVDDGDPRYEWVPKQEIGAEYGVKIIVAAKGEASK